MSGVLRHDPESFELGIDTFKDRVVGGQAVLRHGRQRFAFHRRYGSLAAAQGRESIIERKESRHSLPDTRPKASVGRTRGETRTLCAEVAKV